MSRPSETQKPASIRRASRARKSKRLKWLTPALILLLLVFVFLGGVFYAARQAQNHARVFITEVTQAKTLLIKDHSPAALLEAQEHLAAAQQALNAMRPLAQKVTQAARIPWMTNAPVIGPIIKQANALWTFANAATNLSRSLLNIAIPLTTGADPNEPLKALALLPQIEQDFQDAGAYFTQAQRAKQDISTLWWLPADMQTNLQQTLTQWDALSPYLQVALIDGNQLLNEVDIVQTGRRLQTLTNNLQALSTDFDALDSLTDAENVDPTASLKNIQQHLRAARANLNALQGSANSLLNYADKLKDLPKTDLPVEQLRIWWEFIDLGVQLSQEFAGIAELSLVNLQDAGLPGIAAALPSIHRQLQTARADFRKAQLLRRKLTPVTGLPETLTAPFNAALQQWDALAPRLETAFGVSDSLFKAAPQLLGFNGPVTYLLLLQSSDELRATGGFIGGIGVIQIEQGKIIQTTLREVTELDNTPEVNGQYLTRWTQPPQPLARYMGLGHWYLRDANWWADFPTTARQAADFWRVENNIPLDGVIAVTEQGVSDFLQATGAVVTLSGTKIDAANMKDVTVERIYYGQEPSGAAQSQLLNEMSLALTEAGQDMSPERLLRLGRFFSTAAARRDILIASFDPPTAAGLYDLGLSGALSGQQDDYFYLVESNISYNKLSPFIRQDLQYQVTLDPDGLPTTAALTVKEMNTYAPGPDTAEYPAGYFDGGRWNPQTRQVDQWPTYYGGYTRLYPPPGSEFVAAQGFDEPPDISIENRRVVAGGYLGLLAGETRQLQFKWIPKIRSTQPGQYRLLVQRQPGAPAHALTVIAHLPPQAQVTKITPLPISVTDNAVTWYAALDTDLSFSLQLSPANTTVISAAKAITLPVIPPSPPSPSPTPSSPSSPPRAVAPAPTARPGRAPLPVWLNIPAIDVNAPIISVGLEPGGIMASPDDADLIGWYEFGPRPGEASNAILAGHVDWKGKTGAFARLHELKIGDVIEVKSGPQTGYRYRVISAESYRSDSAPVAEIFGATTQPLLTLITCSGSYDIFRQEYQDRLIVRAQRID